MKLKEFDFKLPREEARKKKIILTRISAIALILVITIASTFAYYQSIENQNPINTSVGEFSSGDVIFAVTIDGVESQIFPTKGSGYVASNVTCDKDANGRWDNNLWSIKVGNLTQTKTVCNINFIDETDTLNYKILAQFGGRNVIEEAPAGKFASLSESYEAIMYKMNDDYGMSYYYRGAKNLLNNNLIFAEHQWKIIRINGDESIRIIYNGACPNNICTINNIGTSTQIKNIQFNENENDNKYLGYMYGGANGVISTSRAQAVMNETNSTIKTEADNWYRNYIENKGYKNYISDTLFCNDRQLAQEAPGAPQTGGAYTGTGYGTNQTYYAPWYRIMANKIPTLKCANKNDRFTVSDFNIGNGALTYPLGLITIDEISLAGGVYANNNSSYYLYTSQNFWSISSMTMVGTAGVFTVDSSGKISTANVSQVFIGQGIRVVINLESGVEVTGNGSTSNPFKVV